jgi:hypothetical protein
MTNAIRLAAILSAAALASSSTAMSPQALSPHAASQLSQALAGRTAGPAVNCVPNFRSSAMNVIDESTIVFGSGRTIYVQKPDGGCPGLTMGAHSLVARKFNTNRMCAGDINQVTDLRTGVIVGSCVFRPFIPYSMAK